MNLNWKKIFQIINKPSRAIIGLMSGTSLDGLDIVHCEIRGHGMSTEVSVRHFKTTAYDPQFKEAIKGIFSKRNVDLQLVSLLNEQIAVTHSEMILAALKEWNVSTDEIDAIASHGQTIYHAPKSLHGMESYPNATLQIGDGDHLAVKTGILTLSDFRQKHLAAGGEGAPLAAYGDYLMFSKPGEDRFMLNIGGIANFTYLPADGDPAKIFSTDVGPGNTLMDQYVQRYFENQYFDEGGAIAGSGSYNEPLLRELLHDPFLEAGFPKTTGPEKYNLAYLEHAQQASGTMDLNHADVLATLCQLTAEVIIKAIKRSGHRASSIFLSGGGMYNETLVAQLKTGLAASTFHTTDSLGIPPDAKEAVLFAVLANETLAGEPVGFGNAQDIPPVCMGKISLPW